MVEWGFLIAAFIFGFLLAYGLVLWFIKRNIHL